MAGGKDREVIIFSLKIKVFIRKSKISDIGIVTMIGNTNVTMFLFLIYVPTCDTLYRT